MREDFSRSNLIWALACSVKHINAWAAPRRQAAYAAVASGQQPDQLGKTLQTLDEAQGYKICIMETAQNLHQGLTTNSKFWEHIGHMYAQALVREAQTAWPMLRSAQKK